MVTLGLFNPLADVIEPLNLLHFRGTADERFMFAVLNAEARFQLFAWCCVHITRME
jgi:hypothetical protein